MIEQDVPHYNPEVTSGPSERYAMPAPHVTYIMLTLLSEKNKTGIVLQYSILFSFAYDFDLKRSHLFELFREQPIEEKSRKIMKHKENMNI